MNSLHKLQETICLTSLSIAVALIPLTVQALTVQEVPNPRKTNGGWVTDMANILSYDAELKLNQMISELETKNGAEIAVVTVPETKPSASPKEFTTELFSYWKIGKQGKDNGVLFLISKGDRRVEIETGYGIEAILPDAKVGHIINKEITPRFKQGDFNNGTLAGTKALILILGNEETNNFTNSENLEQNFNFIWNILLKIGIGIGGFFGISKLWNIYTHRPAYLEPKGRSQLNRKNERPVHCSQCKQLMTKIDQNTLENNLQPPEIEEITKGNLLFEGWQCLQCNPSGFHLRIVVLKYDHSPVYIQPSGQSYITNTKDRLVYCSQCKQLMIPVNQTTLENSLKPPDKTAIKIGSLRYEGWQCSNCNPSGFHLGIVILSYQFDNCPQCYGRTLERKVTTLREATYDYSGERLIIENCHHCDYHNQKHEIIPQIPRPSSSSSSYDSYSSSSGAGSDFGGGDSGGGGAGGDW